MTTIMKRIIAAQNAALDRPSFGVAAMTHSGQSAMVPLILKVTVNGVTFVLPPFGGKDEDMPLYRERTERIFWRAF